MSYLVKEVFHTLQGEGMNAGRAAVFLRFAGCNLWSGRQDDRTGKGSCAAWCDTDFVGGVRYLGASPLAAQVAMTWVGPTQHRFVVCTGGEPLLQLDAALVNALHNLGFKVAIETNGTLPLPRAPIDWVTVSPKRGGELVLRQGDELKLVVPDEGVDPAQFIGLDFQHFLLQPKEAPGYDHRHAMEYCLANPPWKLSLQLHKIVGLP